MLEIYENDKKSNVSEWVTRFKKGKKIFELGENSEKL